MITVDKNKENLNKCICPTCPTYTQCSRDKEELLFCCGKPCKSSCDHQKNGCICGSCSVHSENSLGKYYYCMNGFQDRIEKKK